MPDQRDLSKWPGAARPEAVHLSGRFATCVPFVPDDHAAELFDACAGDAELWRYIPWGPFASAVALHRQMTDLTSDPDYHYFAICDAKTGRAIGKAAYMRMDPDNGVIEVGGIVFSPLLQRKRAATEAMKLLMGWVFANGYRRYEWKCNARNMPSRRAAQRLGFSYEGIFRKHMVVKGQNRDTAWFAVTEEEWPALSQAFDIWLSDENFDPEGRQNERLSDLTALVRVASDPALDG